MKLATLGLCLVIIFAMIPSAAVNSATGPLALKWKIQAASDYGAFHPSMGDINNDGVQEIVIKYGWLILALNGKTGATIWKSWEDCQGGSHILELADITKDGTPEIIYCGKDMMVYARDGAGKLLWKSAKVNGASWPATSIITGDTNKDGYPEIYVVSQAEYKPYTGCITKLDRTGKILARSEICWYPCWGGISLADANFDGEFEIYLGDRSASSGPGGSSTSYPSNPARGLSCYDADTLKTLWTRPDIPTSTPAPVLIDVNKDGKLDVVANCIINNGAIVIDTVTGKDIYNWKGKLINNHAKGTVWDVDLDGHVELISSWGYQKDPKCTKGFTVLDLVTGVIEYRASEINNYVAFPPTVGDVNGDGYLEILAATSGEENHGTVGQGQLYVYDRNYKIVQTIGGFTYGEQLWEPYCVDCDGDGLNEVIIGNTNGQFWCYDTPAKAPSPVLKPYSAWYSPYRQGASVYVAPPGTSTQVVTYSLTLQAPSGSGTTNPSTGTYTYNKGTSIKVTATPSSGWKFDHWILDGASSGTSNPITVTMSSAHTLKAVFSQLVVYTGIFSDGFETGNFNSWTGTGYTSGESRIVSSSKSHHGSYSANFYTNGGSGYEKSYAYKTITGSSELFTRGYFHVSQNGILENTDRINMLEFRSSSGVAVAYAGCRKTSSGQLTWFLSIKSGTSTVTTYSTTTPSLNRWYSVELHWKKGSTDGLAELWIDNVRVCSFLNRDTGAYGDIIEVRCGLTELYNCASTNVYVDCIALSSSYIGTE